MPSVIFILLTSMPSMRNRIVVYTASAHTTTVTHTSTPNITVSTATATIPYRFPNYIIVRVLSLVFKLLGLSFILFLLQVCIFFPVLPTSGKDVCV